MTFAALIALAALCTLCGAVLLLLGLRGRRVNDHPICRRCRFDLVGVYPGADRCPECGGELSASRAVRVGARRRRRGLLVAAAPLLLVGVGGSGGVAWVWGTGFNWYSLSPDWLLESMAGSPDMTHQSAAVAELAARLGGGSLGAQRRDRLVQKAIELQADEDVVWLQEWGDLIGAAITSEVVSREQVESYLQHAISMELSVPEKLRQGEAAMVTIVFRPHRVGASPSIKASFVAPPIEINGAPLTERAGGSTLFWISGSSVMSSAGRSARFDLEPGVYALACAVELDAGIEGGSGAAAEPVTVRRELQATTEIVPRGTPLVEFIPPEPLREQVAQAFRAYGFRAAPASEGAVRLDGTVHSNNPPVPCAFEIFVRVGGREHPWGRTLFPQGADLGWGTSAQIDAPVGPSVDLVLRASEEVAIQNGAHAVWGGEIVIENVPVEREDEPGE